MKLPKFTALFFYLFFITAFARSQTYAVKKAHRNMLTVTGADTTKEWANANILTSFTYPWEKETAPATSFSALWDEDWLYCRYQVIDDSVIVYINRNEKLETGQSDRVEIFFYTDEKMTPYYCLELDASGRILDYRANYYRKMDFEWHWPTGQLTVKTSKTKNGYVVETAISIKSLKELGLLKNNILHAGLFRAERQGIKQGFADIKWISWVNPSSSEPDFHIPSAFGTLVME